MDSNAVGNINLPTDVGSVLTPTYGQIVQRESSVSSTLPPSGKMPAMSGAGVENPAVNKRPYRSVQVTTASGVTTKMTKEDADREVARGGVIVSQSKPGPKPKAKEIVSAAGVRVVGTPQ